MTLCSYVSKPSFSTAIYSPSSVCRRYFANAWPHVAVDIFQSAPPGTIVPHAFPSNVPPVMGITLSEPPMVFSILCASLHCTWICNTTSASSIFVSFIWISRFVVYKHRPVSKGKTSYILMMARSVTAEFLWHFHQVLLSSLHR